MSLIVSILKLFPAHLGDKVMNLLTQNNQTESSILREYYKDRYNIIVDKYTYGSCFSRKFNIGGYVTIGKFCSIADNVHYFGANHPITRVSTSPYFYNQNFAQFDVKDVERHSLEIGNDVWIGHGVLITSNCRNIGTGAVIGSGSVVTHDVPPYAVIAGNPARIIKYRFDEETRTGIMATQWWNHHPEDFKEIYGLMEKPRDFLKALNQHSKW